MDLGGYRTQNPFGWIDVENCRAFLQFSHATYLLLVEKSCLRSCEQPLVHWFWHKEHASPLSERLKEGRWAEHPASTRVSMVPYYLYLKRVVTARKRMSAKFDERVVGNRAHPSRSLHLSDIAAESADGCDGDGTAVISCLGSRKMCGRTHSCSPRWMLTES